MARALTKTDLARLIVYVRSGMKEMPRADDARVRRMMRRKKKALAELHGAARQVIDLHTSLRKDLQTSLRKRGLLQ